MAKKGRGTRTHGHGKHKRASGRRGGKGYAGAKDAKWILTIKGGKLLLGRSSKRGRYGRRGKYGFSRAKVRKEMKAINLQWLDENFEEGAVVNLKELGFDKLLGTGKITKKMKVIAPAWSRKAEEKIKAAGGEIVKAE